MLIFNKELESLCYIKFFGGIDMKKIIHFVLAALLLSLPLSAKEPTVEQSIRNAAAEIAERIDGNVNTVVVLTIHSKDSKTPLWALSDYLVAMLNHEFTNILEKTSVAERDEYSLALIQQESNFQLSGEVSDETIQEIGQALGADCLVSGEIMETSGGWNLTLRATLVESKKIVASSKCKVSGKDKEVKFQVKKSKDPEPVYHLPSKRVAPSEPVSSVKGGISAEMIDEAGRAVDVLHPRDVIRFRVSSDKNAYLAILCIDAKKEENWLPLQNNYIRAGESRIFPDIPGATLRVEDGIFGKEQVKIYSAGIESDLPNQSKMLGTRGFVLQTDENAVSETVIDYQVKK